MSEASSKSLKLPASPSQIGTPSLFLAKVVDMLSLQLEKETFFTLQPSIGPGSCRLEPRRGAPLPCKSTSGVGSSGAQVVQSGSSEAGRTQMARRTALVNEPRALLFPVLTQLRSSIDRAELLKWISLAGYISIHGYLFVLFYLGFLSRAPDG